MRQTEKRYSVGWVVFWYLFFMATVVAAPYLLLIPLTVWIMKARRRTATRAAARAEAARADREIDEYLAWLARREEQQ